MVQWLALHADTTFSNTSYPYPDAWENIDGGSKITELIWIHSERFSLDDVCSRLGNLVSGLRLKCSIIQTVIP